MTVLPLVTQSYERSSFRIQNTSFTSGHIVDWKATENSYYLLLNDDLTANANYRIQKFNQDSELIWEHSIAEKHFTIKILAVTNAGAILYWDTDGKNPIVNQHNNLTSQIIYISATGIQWTYDDYIFASANVSQRQITAFGLTLPSSFFFSISQEIQISTIGSNNSQIINRIDNIFIDLQGNILNQQTSLLENFATLSHPIIRNEVLSTRYQTIDHDEHRFNLDTKSYANSSNLIDHGFNPSLNFYATLPLANASHYFYHNYDYSQFTIINETGSRIAEIKTSGGGIYQELVNEGHLLEYVEFSPNKALLLGTIQGNPFAKHALGLIIYTPDLPNKVAIIPASSRTRDVSIGSIGLFNVGTKIFIVQEMLSRNGDMGYRVTELIEVPANFKALFQEYPFLQYLVPNSLGILVFLLWFQRHVKNRKQYENLRLYPQLKFKKQQLKEYAAFLEESVQQDDKD